MSAQPVDLDQVGSDLASATRLAHEEADTAMVLSLVSLQLQLAMAVDTRRQADATAALVKELHQLRRAK